MGNYLNIGDISFNSKMDSGIAYTLIKETYQELPNLIKYNSIKFSYKIKKKGIEAICIKLNEYSFNDDWIKEYSIKDVSDDYFPEIHGDKEKFFEEQLVLYKESFKRVSQAFFNTFYSMELYDKKKIKVFWI